MRQLTEKPEWADEKFITRNYGLTRTPIYNLRKQGFIRSVAVKAPGATYGKRLYHVPSVEAFLADCEERETQAEAAACGSAQ
jgi:hypothetical protein